jgi:predicted lipid-binding transport protein (Tim44 family)
VAVFLLLAAVWAVVLVPPAVRSHAERKAAFLVGFGEVAAPAPPPARPAPARSEPVRRRRRIAGGLLAAMAATLVVGLLPTFRVFLVVHLFLVDSFLAYVALLAHAANQAARAVRHADTVPAAPRAEPARRRRRSPDPVPTVMPELGPLALG